MKSNNSRLQKLRALAERPGTAAEDAAAWAAYWEQYLRSRLGKTLTDKDVQNARAAWQRKSDELHQAAGPQQYYYYTPPPRKKAAPQQGRGDDGVLVTLLVMLAVFGLLFLYL